MSNFQELRILTNSSKHRNLSLTLRDQNVRSSEARDPAKFTNVIRKGANLTVRGSHMQFQLGASDLMRALTVPWMMD